MLIEYHRNMLADRARNAAFHKALKKTVRKGVTVADIGSGTGLLGFMARKLGAKEVHLYESGPIMEVALRLAKANRMTGCHFFHGPSTEFLDPAPADVVVSETLGNYPFEENIIATMNDAQRFLKPGGTLIPQGLVQYACPVVTDREYRRFDAWETVGFGLDYGLARTMSLNNVYVRAFRPKDLLDGGRAGAAWDSIDFRRTNASARRGRMQWTIRKAATVYGLSSWWDCTLTPGVVLSTGPFAKKGHWEQLYFPVLAPLRVKAGDVLSATLSSATAPEGGTDLNWALAVNGKARQVMGLRKGYLA